MQTYPKIVRHASVMKLDQKVTYVIQTLVCVRVNQVSMVLNVTTALKSISIWRPKAVTVSTENVYFFMFYWFQMQATIFND